LEGFERGSFYQNKHVTAWQQKAPHSKGIGNIEETKRLFVIERICNALWPRKGRSHNYRKLRALLKRPHHRRFEPCRDIEKRLQRFERNWIHTNRLTLRQVVLEQYERYKVHGVSAANLEEMERIKSLPPERNSERIASVLRIKAQFAFSGLDSAAADVICEPTKAHTGISLGKNRAIRRPEGHSHDGDPAQRPKRLAGPPFA
jgi:hypothetical protein